MKKFLFQLGPYCCLAALDGVCCEKKLDQFSKKEVLNEFFYTTPPPLKILGLSHLFHCSSNPSLPGAVWFDAPLCSPIPFSCSTPIRQRFIFFRFAFFFLSHKNIGGVLCIIYIYIFQDPIDLMLLETIKKQVIIFYIQNLLPSKQKYFININIKQTL